MLKNLFGKARDLATPERIEALKNGAAKAMDAANRGAGIVQARAAQALDERKQRQKEVDMHPAVKKTLENYANGIAAAETDTRIRGAGLLDLTSAPTIQLLRSKTPETAITIGGVPIDSGDEQQHILLAGAPGTGKSVEIKKALRTIRARGQRAVVYDPSGEFTSMYYRPGVDIILNPLDERGSTWNPWQDAESYEFNAVAKSFIKDAGDSSDPFWTESARATLEALLLQCGSLDELVYTGLSAPLHRLAQIVDEAGFSGMVGPEKTFQSTRATLAVYLRTLAMMPDVQRSDDTAFSFRKWAENGKQDAWVFLPVPARARDAIRPLVSLFLDTAVRHIMSLRPDPDRRIWLEIDELPSLQNIPSLSPALAEGRKFGISAILGVQTFHQLKKSFGDAGAQALWGLPKTRLYLRIADAETSDMISRELGEVQLLRKTKSSSESSSISTGSGNNGGSSSESSSTSENEQITQERIVLPAEIMGLPDLVGYLRTGGSHRVAKVRVQFDGIPRRGDQEDFIWKAQRPLPSAESIKAAKAGSVDISDGQQDQGVARVEAALNTTEGQQKQGGTISTGQQDQGVASAEADAEALDLEVRIRDRALELMRESMGEWDDASVAALTDDEMSELTKIFIERAEIEIASGGSAA